MNKVNFIYLSQLDNQILNDIIYQLNHQNIQTSIDHQEQYDLMNIENVLKIKLNILNSYEGYIYRYELFHSHNICEKLYYYIKEEICYLSEIIDRRLTQYDHFPHPDKWEEIKTLYQQNDKFIQIKDILLTKKNELHNKV